jgi:uncharacterized membrane protein YfcA
MILGFETVMFVAILGIVFLGGFVKGVAGFGYAIASTAILPALVSPSTTVVVMTLLMLAANVRLLGELDRSDLRTCLARFWPFVGAAVPGLAGVAVGGRVRRVVPERYQTAGALLLLVVIGVRLTTAGPSGLYVTTPPAGRRWRLR